MGYSSYSEIVFADTPGKAKSLALNTDEFCRSDWDYTDLKAKRVPELDSAYRGRLWMEWDNMDDRVAMVKKAGFVCDPDYANLEDCEGCGATEWCEQYERMVNEAMEYTDIDHCYECRGLGDDYEIDGEELVSRCETCTCNPNRRDDDE